MKCKRCYEDIADGSLFCNYCGKKQTAEPTGKRPKHRRPKGSGTISKLQGRRGKPYQAKLSLPDGRRAFLGYYATVADAQTAIDNAVVVGVPELRTITVAEAYDRWSKTHFTTLTPKGVEGIVVTWKRFDSIKTIKLRDVRADTFQGLINTAVENNMSRSTCEKIKQLASQLCKFGMKNDILTKNYAEFLELPKVEQSKAKVFSDDDLRRMYEGFERTHDRHLGEIIVLCYTGLRIGEFLKMKKSDFYNGCLHGGSKTEKGKNRTVPVPDGILPILQYIIDECSESEYIVPSPMGGMYDQKNYRNRVYKPTLERFGIEVLNPHMARHTFATRCVEGGIDTKALSDILGHESFETTANKYTHTDVEWLSKNVNRLTIPGQQPAAENAGDTDINNSGRKSV